MTMEQLRKLERIKESAPGVFDDAYMEAISRAVYDDEGDRQNAVDELMEREVMQWYLVDDFLADQLTSRGDIVLGIDGYRV